MRHSRKRNQPCVSDAGTARMLEPAKIEYAVTEEVFSTGFGPEGPPAGWSGTWSPPAPYGPERETRQVRASSGKAPVEPLRCGR